MKKILLSILFAFALSSNAQNPADVDLIVGSGFVGFHFISDIAVQPNGKIVVAGLFFDLDNWATKVKVIRYNNDGSIDNSFPIVNFSENEEVDDIVIQADGKILIAGNFSKMNNELVGSIVRLNADGSKDNSFIGLTSNFYANSIAVQPDGKIILGGFGTCEVNGYQQKCLVRLNTNGTIDNTFNFGFMSGFAEYFANIYKVVLQPDGKILAGGFFTLFNGSSQGKLIRFNSDGTKDNTFDIGIGSTDNGSITDIELESDGKILICGGFSLWNGQAFGHLCRLNSNGSIDTSFVNMFNSIDSVEGASEIEIRPDGKILAICAYTENYITYRMALLNTDGSQDNTFTGNADNTLTCLKVLADGKILLGGFMSWERSETIRNGMAKLNPNGTTDTTFNTNTGLNNEVNSIALQTDNKTILGGSFTFFNGASQNKLLRLNDNGTKDSSFTIGTGFNDSVKSIAVQTDGKIIVGGNFTTFNGQTTNYIIRLNNNGTKDTSFNIGSGFDNSVQTIQLQTDGKIVVGGSFTSFNGLQQNYLIRLNSDGTKDTNFISDNAFDGKVNSILVKADSKIIVGGSFDNFNGLAQSRLVVLNNNGTKDSGFSLTETIYTDVTDIALQTDGKIVVAMYFLQRFNADGSSDTAFNSNLHDFSILMLGDTKTVAIQENGQILVGGSFMAMDMRPNRIIRLNTDGTKDLTFDTSMNNDGSVVNITNGFTEGACNDIVIQPDKKVWVGGSFFHYRGITSFSALRLVGNNLLGNNDLEIGLDKIIASPNPVRNILHINKTAKSIQLFDVTGKRLTSIENSDYLDFTKYSEGIYLINVELENGEIQTEKIIKK